MAVNAHYHVSSECIKRNYPISRPNQLIVPENIKQTLFIQEIDLLSYLVSQPCFFMTPPNLIFGYIIKTLSFNHLIIIITCIIINYHRNMCLM